MKQTQVILSLLLPPRQDAAEAVHPTVGAFHDPSSGLEARLAFERLGLFATASDMSRVPELLRQVSGFFVVVPFIQA